MATAARHRNWLTASLAGLVAVAWAALWWLERSPWAAVFHAHAGTHHHTPPGIPDALVAALFVAGWTLMVVAMMLPTTLPVAEIFRRLVRRREDAGQLLTSLIAGYLTMWTGFGVLVYLAGQALGAIDPGVPGWAFSAGLFLLAGAFQFSTLKYRCLERCRAPLGFVLARWRGKARGRWDAFRIGADHGVFCVGCCWALMLLMFVAATANLLWMLVLGLLMATEKNVAWGRRIGEPLGLVLITAGLTIAIIGGTV